jgi:hypothetical protein
MKKPTLLQHLLQESITSKKISGSVQIGTTDFEPPFKVTGYHIVDANDKILCKCDDKKIAHGLVDILWDLV